MPVPGVVQREEAWGPWRPEFVPLDGSALMGTNCSCSAVRREPWLSKIACAQAPARPLTDTVPAAGTKLGPVRCRRAYGYRVISPETLADGI